MGSEMCIRDREIEVDVIKRIGKKMSEMNEMGISVPDRVQIFTSDIGFVGKEFTAREFMEYAFT